MSGNRQLSDREAADREASAQAAHAEAVAAVASELEAGGAKVSIMNPVPGVAIVTSPKHPKLVAAWATARPFARAALYGAAFAGGALVLTKLFGPRTARALGRTGGEGFAQGVNEVQARIATVTRGMRWG